MEREHITDRAHGIDVSHHQESFILDKTWGQIDFAIAKFGEGYNSPYSAGALGDFKDFMPLWNEGCARVDIRGLYFYQRSPAHGYSWLRQAEEFLEAARKLNVQPHLIACDVEGGNNIIDKSFLADTKRIMDYWKQNSNYTVVLYTNKDTLKNKVIPVGKAAYGIEWLDQLKAYPLWYAQYWFVASPNKQPGTLLEWSDWDIWQYTESGDSKKLVDGTYWRHYGSPDLNVYNGSVLEMKQWLKIDDATTPPPVPPAADDWQAKYNEAMEELIIVNAKIGRIKEIVG